MRNEPMIAKGIRLPREIWEAIELEAASLQMERSEYMRRRLSSLFRSLPEARAAGAEKEAAISE